VWALVLMADFVLEFRFEYLWPFWLLLRSVYDSFKYQGLVSIILVLQVGPVTAGSSFCGPWMINPEGILLFTTTCGCVIPWLVVFLAIRLWPFCRAKILQFALYGNLARLFSKLLQILNGSNPSQNAIIWLQMP
jgi:hypothetical protein